VACEVAEALGAPLDIVVVRKLGAPGQPELGIGVVVDGDHPRAIFNREAIESLGVADEYINREIERQLKEIKRRESDYLGTEAAVPLAGKTVILVDDGIATGSSVRAALRGLRRAKPRQVVLAGPVAHAETLEARRDDADKIVCLETPENFFAVGQFYRDFHQVSDDEVKRILAAGIQPKRALARKAEESSVGREVKTMRNETLLLARQEKMGTKIAQLPEKAEQARLGIGLLCRWSFSLQTSTPLAPRTLSDQGNAGSSPS
jgi:putative phosphoribosyl transferase